MTSRVLRLAGPAILLAALAGCGGHGGGSAHREGPPPGPAGDPWGPYIKEASGRFHVPERWVRAVMHQESGGHEFLNGRPITSWAGAAGLMQVMPGTYAELAARYGLGSDPYDPHDNIMAGTAYIHELYQQFGSPGFLAAYNAGPGRMNTYLAGRSALPVETVNYMASISPRLGPDAPDAGTPDASAPVLLASARTAPPRPAPDLTPIAPSYVAPVPDEPAPARSLVASAASALVPAASAEPLPARPAPPATTYAAPSALAAASPPYVPTAQVPPASASSAYAPPAAPREPRTEYRLVAGPAYADMRPGGQGWSPAAVAARTAPGAWSIQVGAYSTPTLARLATEGARQGANLQNVQTAIVPVSHPGGGTLFRARLSGMSSAAAHEACGRLRAIGSDCNVVPPATTGA